MYDSFFKVKNSKEYQEMIINKKMNQFSKEIYDVDLKILTKEQIELYKKDLYKHRLIVFKKQNLSAKEFVDFSKKFGFPEPYLQENYHHPDYPEIFVSSNIKTDNKMGVARTGGYWHCDTAFQQIPMPLTMLMPIIIPKEKKRNTLFIDMSEVYEEMSEALKSKLQKIDFMHSGRWRYKVREEDIGMDITEILALIDSVAPATKHPAVMIHPYTKENILYATSGFTVGSPQLSLDEFKILSKEIFEFAELPRFIKSVEWHEGDLIIWDNRFLSHKSGHELVSSETVQKDFSNEEESMMFRITAGDGMPLHINEKVLVSDLC